MPVSPEIPAPRSLGGLAHLLHALVGRPIALHWLDANNGPGETTAESSARAIVRTDSVLLAVSDERERLLASVAHAAAHLLHSPMRQPVAKLKPMGIAVASALEDARAEWLMIRRYPGLQPLLRRRAHLACAAPLGPDGSFPNLIARLNHALLDPLYRDDNHWVGKGRQLFHDSIDALANADHFRKLALLLANDLGQMRVRMNLQGYTVPQDHGDDNSCLWDFTRTAESETPVFIPPPGTRVTQGQQNPLHPQAEPPPPSLHSYPEFDHRQKRHREHWTTVIEHRMAHPSPQPTPGPARLLAPNRCVDHGLRLRRQWEGDDIDIDAATEWMLARRIGAPLDPRIHRSAGHRPPQLSLLLLLDLSASANQHIGDADRSILELTCEAALALVRTAHANRDRIAVHGFSSNTRHQVDYLRLHEFGDSGFTALAQRLSRLQARHSTRLGAALRHATACLQAEVHPSRHIVLLSDGECSDIDVFDPTYLREDAMIATHKAKLLGIRVTALAISPNPKTDLNRILGWGRFRTVMRPNALSRNLQELYEQLRANR